jgi:hypothetical protein
MFGSFFKYTYKSAISKTGIRLNLGQLLIFGSKRPGLKGRLQKLRLAIMITVDMNVMYGIKKYGADKIALLGFFVVALLIAQLVVVWRSAILLSEPIRLEYGGLSASVPVGNGWRSERQWRYQNSEFILSSFFETGSGNITAMARCRYSLAASAVDAEMVFDKKASEVGGAIENTGLSQAGPLTINWAYIIKPQTLYDTVLGLAHLPNNHQLDIEVYQTTGDIDLTKRVFNHIIESLQFEDNQLFEAGSRVVAGIKSRGLDSFLPGPSAGQSQNGLSLDEQGGGEFFLIRDARGREIGFTMGLLGRLANQAEFSQTSFSIQGTGFYYVRSGYDTQQVTFFESDNSFDEFVWKSETGDIKGRRATEIVLGRDGIMTVKKFGVRSGERGYRISSATIPEFLGELIFEQMVYTGDREIFADIVDAEGRIIPAFVSRIEVEDIAAGEEYAYAFEVKLLNGRGFSERVYLDERKRISKRILQQEDLYTLERTDLEEVLRRFPQWTDFILGAMQGSRISGRGPL